MRECGGCTICCALLEVGEPLNLKAGEKCQFQCVGGCSEYEIRPNVCRSYACEWLNGEMSDNMHPSQRGLLTSRYRSHFGEVIELREVWSGVLPLSLGRLKDIFPEVVELGEKYNAYFILKYSWGQKVLIPDWLPTLKTLENKINPPFDGFNASVVSKE